MIIKKNKVDSNILFIDGFSKCVKVTNNKLTPKNIDNIIAAFAERQEKKHFTYLATYDEVKVNNYNLFLSSYVEVKDTREKLILRS